MDELGGIGFDQRAWNDTDLPAPPPETMHEIRSRAVARAAAIDVEAAVAKRDERVPLFNAEQRSAFDAIVADIRESRDATIPPRARLHYVDGPGGSGKTFLYEGVIHEVHAENEIALACAFSGIAATLLPGGVTAHKLFGAGPNVSADTPSQVGAHTAQAEILRRARVVLWDEAGMSPKALFAYADKVLQDLTGNVGVPFGGKIVVVGGDWRQILPVVPFGDRAEVIAATLQMHYTWRENRFRLHRLVSNMRAATAATT